MILHYPEIPQDDIDRQGTTWVFCDVQSCPAASEVDDVEEATVGRRTYRYAPMPEGWVTNDPEDNAFNGSAQFCEEHANRVVKPQKEEPVEEPPVVEPEVTPDGS